MAGHAAIGAMQAETPGLEPAAIRATAELSTGPLGHQILPRKAADSVDYDNSTIGPDSFQARDSNAAAARTSSLCVDLRVPQRNHSGPAEIVVFGDG
jgi:hypothetical protein